MLNKIFASGPLALALSLLVPACQPDDEGSRPAPIQSGSNNGIVGGDGDNSGGAEGDPGDVLTGSLEQYVDDTFLQKVVYTRPSTVFVIDESGTSSVDGEFDGAELAVDGVTLTNNRWVAVEAINDNTIYPTVSQHDLRSGSIVAPLVPIAVVDEIFTKMTPETQFNEARAHILMRVVDGAGNGVEGVTPSVFSASTDSEPAYALDGQWLALDDSTNPEGLIFFANLEAPALPGQNTQIELTGTTEAEVTVRLVSGAITVVTVLVP